MTSVSLHIQRERSSYVPISQPFCQIRRTPLNGGIGCVPDRYLPLAYGLIPRPQRNDIADYDRACQGPEMGGCDSCCHSWPRDCTCGPRIVDWAAELRSVGDFQPLAHWRDQSDVLNSVRAPFLRFSFANLPANALLAVCNSFGLPRRIVGEPKILPDYVLFDEPSYEEAPIVSGIIAVLFRGVVSLPDLTNSSGMPIWHAAPLYTPTSAPDYIAHIRDTAVIYGIEMFTVVASIFAPRYRLRGCAVAVYLDNNAPLSALIKGDSIAIPVSRRISFMRYEAYFLYVVCGSSL